MEGPEPRTGVVGEGATDALAWPPGRAGDAETAAFVCAKRRREDMLGLGQQTGGQPETETEAEDGASRERAGGAEDACVMGRDGPERAVTDVSPVPHATSATPVPSPLRSDTRNLSHWLA